MQRCDRSRAKSIGVTASNDYDILVIGGGIFGACTLWEATLRGYNAALLESFDFCSGSSANSYKIVHGGTRYLQHMDLIRLRASSRERRAMLNIAPHLVEPLPIMVPTYGMGKLSKPFLGVGLSLYDLLTLDRNRGISVPERCLKRTRFLSRQEVLNEFPSLNSAGLTGACVFEDGRFYNPTRLVYTFIKSAVLRGAAAVNYCPVTDFIINDKRVIGVRAKDKQTGQSIAVKAKVVVNAAGPWAERLLHQSLPNQYRPGGTYSRDACFVINRRFPGKYTLAVQGQTKDPDAVLSRPARHLFLSPWRNYTLVGVWHKVTDLHPESVNLSSEELQVFIDEINASYPSLQLKLEDVKFCNYGLVPFGENEEGSQDLSYGKRSLLMDHKALNGVDGLVSIIGVRYTMARGEAEKTLNVVEKKLGREPQASLSDKVKLWGGEFDSFTQLKAAVASEWPFEIKESTLDSIAHNFGSGYRELLPLVGKNSKLAEPIDGADITGAEVVYSCRSEMVCSLNDIVFRRTDLGTGGNPGDSALHAVGKIVQSELGWSNERLSSEISAVKEKFQTFGR